MHRPKHSIDALVLTGTLQLRHRHGLHFRAQVVEGRDDGVRLVWAWCWLGLQASTFNDDASAGSLMMAACSGRMDMNIRV